MKKSAKRAPPAARKIIVKSSAAAPKSSVRSGKTVVVTAAAEAMEAAGSGQGTWSTSVSLESLRKRQDMFAKERDWEQYHTPRNLALAMVGEVDSFVASVMMSAQIPRANSDILRTERLENCASVSSGGLILQLLLGCLAGVTLVSNSAKASYVCVCVCLCLYI